MGKYFRLLAVQEDPIYLCALWDRHKQVDNASVHIYMYTCLLHRGFSLAQRSGLNTMEFEHCRGISRNGTIKLEMETLKTQDTICFCWVPITSWKCNTKFSTQIWKTSLNSGLKAQKELRLLMWCLSSASLLQLSIQPAYLVFIYCRFLISLCPWWWLWSKTESFKLPLCLFWSNFLRLFVPPENQKKATYQKEIA